MSYNLRYLPLATSDLEQLGEYLSQFYPGSLSHVLRDIEEKLTRLSDNPQMYETYAPNPFYRKISVDRYLIFYHVNDELKTVDIYRILRGTWNLPEFV